MKRMGVIFCLAALVIMFSAAPCFAKGLNLVDNYPRDGSDTSPPQNLGIKLFFDGDVSAPELRKDNEACFSMAGPDGKTVPLLILYKDSEPNYVLVIATPEDSKNGLGSDTEYTFTISEDLRSTDDRTLDEPQVINFRTRDVSTDLNVNMAMMGVMFVGMLVFSSLSMRRQLKKQYENEENRKVNPYKVAKETGKSVEEVVEMEERKRRKAAKKKAAGGAAPGESGAAAPPPENDPSNRGVKRVKAPRPISEAGSVYKTGRKAEAERRAKAEAERRAKAEAERRARGTTNPKGGGAKNKKKK